MKIYTISGLGADQRVFESLKVNAELRPLDWIEPLRNESLGEYASRLSEMVDPSQAFGLLGVSFGGMVAVEMAEMIKPQFTIIISSAAANSELPLLYRWAGKLRLPRLLPARAFIIPRPFANFLFGAKNKDLLASILHDTNPAFAKWAIGALTAWSRNKAPQHTIRIHGTHDRIIPNRKAPPTSLVQGGTHFMIVDRAEEISTLINNYLTNSKIS
ncbi:MAG: alpha/beta hydrolase [Flavobacteriales bacterium]|nr:alpha/beta hydrolase [Flavobacteriales bacterium]